MGKEKLFLNYTSTHKIGMLIFFFIENEMRGAFALKISHFFSAKKWQSFMYNKFEILRCC